MNIAKFSLSSASIFIAILTMLLAINVSVLGFSSTVNAAPGDTEIGEFDDCPIGSTNRICNDTGARALFGQGSLLRGAIQLLIWLVGFASIAFVTLGGFQFVTAQGDPGQIEKAKNTIIWSLAGLVVAIGSQGILTFIIDRI
jgi:hypothetical protein